MEQGLCSTINNILKHDLHGEKWAHTPESCSYGLTQQHLEKIYCVMFIFRATFLLSEIATAIPSSDSGDVLEKKQVIMQSGFPHSTRPRPSPHSDWNQGHSLRRCSRGSLDWSFFPSSAEVLCLFPLTETICTLGGKEKPEIHRFPHENRPLLVIYLKITQKNWPSFLKIRTLNEAM